MIEYNTPAIKPKNKNYYFKKNKKSNYSKKIDMSVISPPYDLNYNTLDFLDNLNTDNLSINKLNTSNTQNIFNQPQLQPQLDTITNFDKPDSLTNNKLIEFQEKEDLKLPIDTVDKFNPAFINKCYESLSNDNFNLCSVKPKNNQINQSNQVNKFTKLYQNQYIGRKDYVKYDKHNIICCNCGEKGHVYKKCLYPITSIGIICLNGSKLSQSSKNKLINLEKQINFKSADLDNPDKKNKKKFENIPIENYNCQTFNKNLFNSNIFNSGCNDNIRTIKYKQNISDYSKLSQKNESSKTEQNNILTPNKPNQENIESSLEYLVIRRKDSLSFSEIALAQYKLETEDDINYLLKIMRRLTQDEITFLMNVQDASDIWNKVWNSKKYNKTQSPQPQPHSQSPQHQPHSQSPQSHSESPDSPNMKPANIPNNRVNLSKTKNNNEYLKVTSKLQQIINGVNIGNKFISFKTLLNGIESKWNEPEWGFPKGRRNLKESDLDCALREFQEETNIKKNQITILTITPIIEYFKGTNNINYKHIYYFAICNTNINFNKKNKYQYSEISDIAWMDSNTIIDKVRDDYPDRKLMIKTVSDYFQSNL
jgi:8-oxo-dGTP pyrophosphatase MutT (NUDIX family)